ncbi:MAG: hypothetical protein M1817_003034 [Caeruleum heppii]|nr:MAG: hypothetical protein M1817_003034 [Caeruleum heppii]
MAFFLRGGHRPRIRLTALVLTLWIVYVVWRWREGASESRKLSSPLDDLADLPPSSASTSAPFPASDPAPSAHLVIASLRGDDTSWLDHHLSDYSRSLYVADDPTAALTVSRNKGRESMVYLTYLLTHYDDLPDVMIFIHSLRYQWHNDDPLYDGVPMLKSLQLDKIKERGYANLRCAHTLGCPAEIRPLPVNASEPRDKSDTSDRGKAEMVFAQAFKELFPDGVAGVKEGEVPEAVGVGCCAQFAVSGEMVRRNGREMYERWRRWILETDLSDAVGGRVLEYSWHSMFSSPRTCHLWPSHLYHLLFEETASGLQRDND